MLSCCNHNRIAIQIKPPPRRNFSLRKFAPCRDNPCNKLNLPPEAVTPPITEVAKLLI